MVELHCDYCGWEGTEDELKSVMVDSNIGHDLDELYECPDCKHTEYLTKTVKGG